MPASHVVVFSCRSSVPACTKRSDYGLRCSWWCGCASCPASPVHGVFTAGVACTPPGSACPSGQLPRVATPGWRSLLFCGRHCVFNLVCLLPGFWFRVSVVMGCCHHCDVSLGPRRHEHGAYAAVGSHPPSHGPGPRGGRATVEGCSRQGLQINVGFVLGIRRAACNGWPVQVADTAENGSRGAHSHLER